MNSEAPNSNKENEIAKDQTYPRECLSPQTQQCVDLLMVGRGVLVIMNRA